MNNNRAIFVVKSAKCVKVYKENGVATIFILIILKITSEQYLIRGKLINLYKYINLADSITICSKHFNTKTATGEKPNFISI